jgi:hypothetical protein
MFEVGDKLIYTGKKYSELIYGKTYTIKYIKPNQSQYTLFTLEEVSARNMYYSKSFITEIENRKNKILKIKNRICLK